jgi:hypothetical protein
MVDGVSAGAYMQPSYEYENAQIRLRAWFDAVNSFRGTAEELNLLLNDFEAWAEGQAPDIKRYAKGFIDSVRDTVKAREKQRKSKRKPAPPKEEKETETKPGKEPRPKGPGRVVWISPPTFPYQTTPSKGCEGAGHVIKRKHEVYGIEMQLNQKLGEGYKPPPGGGWQAHIHLELKEPLDRFRDAIQEVYGYPGPIEVNSCYRPLGTHIPPNEYMPKGDECGYLDQTDGKGHWKGKAVDLKTKPIRRYFGIPDEEKNRPNFLDDIGKVVGLRRPYLNKADGVHWTYCKPTRKKFPTIIIDGLTYGGTETNP